MSNWQHTIEFSFDNYQYYASWQQYSGVSIAGFELVNAGWEASKTTMY